ncbi:MAG: hypothetical protein V3T30_02930, partial [Thermodesulfobacteriota bacterium]
MRILELAFTGPSRAPIVYTVVVAIGNVGIRPRRDGHAVRVEGPGAPRTTEATGSREILEAVVAAVGYENIR